MRPESRREVQDWLNRAEYDLAAAEQLTEGSVPRPATAAYLSQQAAEKALKGFLAAHDQPIPRTHDLDRLVVICLGIEEAFVTVEHPAHILSPYAMAFRYPGGPLEPPLAEALRALHLAREIIQLVRSRLQDEGVF